MVRLLQGYDPKVIELAEQALNLDALQKQALAAGLNGLALQIPFAFLPLQDTVDLASLLIDTTIALQEMMVTQRGVGGPVDVAVITRQGGFRPIRRKKLAAILETEE